MKITNIYKENWPDAKLIGKRYTNEDRDEQGTFAKYWQQCFKEGWFVTLKQCRIIPDISKSSFGMMRVTSDGFEYWIGSLFDSDSVVPEGFEAVDIPAGEVGICWLQGNEKSGEIYSQEASDLAMEAFVEKGFQFSNSGWFFERYDSQRFTEPDEDGNVILDIGTYLI